MTFGPSVRRRLLTWAFLAVLGSVAWCESSRPCVLASQNGGLELDVKSDYSHVRVRRSGDMRNLMFVRDSGQEVIETSLDLKRPYRLISDYTRFMFMSYVLRPNPEKVLIVGLGGGAMVHFIKHYDPGVKVDVVEIDPAIVRIAGEFFGIRSEGNVRIVTADAKAYLVDTSERYDVIYMDAFLKPSASTDGNGVPLPLKAIPFYKQIQQALKPGGVVVFNLNPHPQIRDDVLTISGAFPQVYAYQLPYSSGLVVVASTARKRESLSAMHGKAKQLDRRFATTFSFQQMANELLGQ